jgi:hypothetical protein
MDWLPKQIDAGDKYEQQSTRSTTDKEILDGETWSRDLSTEMSGTITKPELEPSSCAAESLCGRKTEPVTVLPPSFD